MPTSGQGSEPASYKIYQGVLQPRGFPGLPEDWTSEWETYPSFDQQVQLFAAFHHVKTGHIAPGQGHRALLVCHGIGEHGGRYLHFAQYLHGAVDAIFCPDHRGHGRSEGLRGHIERFKFFSEDLVVGIRRLDAELKKRFGKSEIHVLGHSMGSLVLLQALVDHGDLPIASAVLSAPLLGIKVDVPFAKKAAASTLSRVWGSLQLSSGLDPQKLSRDPEVVNAYQRDRLVHMKITPRLYMEMTTAMLSMAKRDSGIPYPILAIIPMADQIVDPDQSIDFFRKLKIRDKQLKTYPGFSHESFNDIGKEKAFEDLRAWITQHPKAQ